MDRIIAATRNKHKVLEMNQITKAFSFKVITMEEAKIPMIDVEETGETFEENSYLKAKTIMDLSGKATIADDSGLEVDYLNGAPGVYSARFSGEEATDKKNNEKLLEELKGVPLEKRTARFVSVITMIYPDGKKIVARGTVEGHIIDEERGTEGFGYDSLFIPCGYEHTFGELGGEIKNEISHRGQALKKLKEMLEKSQGSQ